VLPGSQFTLVKPTIKTPFYIDFEWWQQNDRSWRVYLRSYLSEEDRQRIESVGDEQLVDLIDSETAEIRQVDGLQHLLITDYASRPEFITGTTSVTESIFRLLLANGNVPLSPAEIGERLGRDPLTILRTLSGPRIFKGIRPLS